MLLLQLTEQCQSFFSSCAYHSIDFILKGLERRERERVLCQPQAEQETSHQDIGISFCSVFMFRYMSTLENN